MSTKHLEYLLDDLAGLDDREGPARRIEPGEAEALVRGAMQRARLLPKGRGGSHVRVAQRRLSGRRGVLLGVGVLAATTAAAAFGTDAGRGWLARWARPDPVQPDAVREVDPPSALAVRTTAARPTARSLAKGSSAPVETPAPTLDMPRDRTPAEPPPVVKGSTGSGQPLPVSPPAAREAPPNTEPPEQAVDLLALANDHRRQKRYRQALQVYQQVAERYPNTRQAEAARLAAAALRLEHLDDAEGAASEYRASAALRGQLSEEAAYGLAEAHRAAGKTDLEKRQLEQFIASYPKSPLAPSARRRLIEIEAR